jgi:hypothetical protein
MKKTITLSLFILTACNTGNVQVGSGASTNQPGASGTTQGSTGDNEQPGTGSKNGASKELFFERVRVSNATAQFVFAIDFTSANSAAATPEGIPLNGNQIFSASSPFTPSKDEVVYLLSVDVGTDALLTTNLDTFDSKQIFSFPRQVVGFSLNSDHSAVAWIDSIGALTVSKTEAGAGDETLDTTLLNPNVSLTQVQWNSDDSQLLASADDGEALLYKTGTAKPTVLSGVNVSSFSADGTELAYFNSTTKTLHVVDLGTGKDTASGTFESSEIHDLSWNSATSLSYWTVLASGAKELRVFTTGGNEQTVASLTLPSSVKDGVVCPAWVGNRVYFGNYDSGKYVIEQIDLNKDSKKAAGVTLFAETPDADLSEGFVCPKVVK